MLSVDGLRVSYGDTLVLDGVDLELAQGESVAIVGPSGVGKSSLLLALCGLLRPTGGTICVGDIDLAVAPTRVRDRIRRTMFGFVFQFGDLVPELSIIENVALPLRLLGTRRREALDRAREPMTALGIDSLADKPVTGVSGGELQRAAICRALVHRPAIVLADEPTGALDDANAELVFDQLLRHSVDVGAGVVVVTHRSPLAERADRLLTIKARTLVPA